MKILRFETYPVRLPLKRTVKWATGEQHSVDYVYLRVVTDEGIFGIGEGPASSSSNGPRALVDSLHQQLEPALYGLDPLARHKVWSVMDSIPAHPLTKVMVEAALLEIGAKAAGQPCWRWLGGGDKGVAVSRIITRDETEDMVQDVLSAVESYGFGTVKFKVGRSLEEDVELLRLMHGALGDDVKVYVDANYAYSAAAAKEFSRILSDFGISYFEDPCLIESVEQFSELNAEMAVPILVDHPCSDALSCQNYLANGARAVALKLGVLGYRGGHFTTELARLYGSSTFISSRAEGELGCLVAAHYTAGGIGRGDLPPETSFFLELAGGVVEPPPLIRDGKLLLSDDPGYGVDLDIELLKTYSI